MTFHRMVSMERTPAEKAEEVLSYSEGPSVASIPNVPYGLCICLEDESLDKLGIEEDDDPDVGDLIHLSCMARVTSVSCQDTGGGKKRRVELAIVLMSAEDEDREATDEGLD